MSISLSMPRYTYIFIFSPIYQILGLNKQNISTLKEARKKLSIRDIQNPLKCNLP